MSWLYFGLPMRDGIARKNPWFLMDYPSSGCQLAPDQPIASAPANWCATPLVHFGHGPTPSVTSMAPVQGRCRAAALFDCSLTGPDPVIFRDVRVGCRTPNSLAGRGHG